MIARIRHLWYRWWLHVDWVGAVLIGVLTFVLIVAVPWSGAPGWPLKVLWWLVFNALIHLAVITDEMQKHRR